MTLLIVGIILTLNRFWSFAEGKKNLFEILEYKPTGGRREREMSPVEDDRGGRRGTEGRRRRKKTVEEDDAGVCSRRKWSRECTFESDKVASGCVSEELQAGQRSRRRTTGLRGLAGNRRSGEEGVSSRLQEGSNRVLGFIPLYTRVKPDRVWVGSRPEIRPNRVKISPKN